MGITEYDNYIKNKRNEIMEMGQKPAEKEAEKIFNIEKTMALTVFKKYYPDAVISFNTPEVVKEIEIVEEPKGPSKEEIEALKKENARLIAEEEAKAIKKAELEAALKALDDS